MNKPVCVIVGVGSGNGAAFSRKFAAKGYRVAMLSRNLDYLESLAVQIPDSQAYQYDVTEIDKAAEIFKQIESEMGTISVVVYNAGAGAFANIDDATVESFQRAWEVNARGLFIVAQQVIPQMRKINGGNIVIIGATASVKGGANFTPFASAKAAQRGLAQSLARYLDPEKIHVAYIILDGVVDLERTRKAMSDKPDDYFMSPDDIAESVFFLTQQPQSAWTFELDLRPFGEKW
ncbi:SDR family NAD(P)-dependent oxidoreductase [Pleurocapsa sp. FMAR1]|uniref:SDR family NAD(P)-dependent oxidoreductase n=1 Tax=Pleurocapsa sp. FMAR1 TaxID=3040204 RepID=UPI0029C7BA99|nr:SDR family NAD(P)-dependent oxidoreductase [Pleurocapsa sp. FMAR1]